MEKSYFYGRCFLQCLVVLVFFHVLPPVYAQGLLDKLGVEIEFSTTLDFYSDYVWRGFLLDRDPVFQSGLTMSAYGFSYTFWSSWDASNNQGAQSDEIDYVFDYTKHLNDLVSISLGHTYYDFPKANSYSKEFYLGLGLRKIPGIDVPVETNLTYYRDYGDQNNGGGLGHYFSFDSSYSHPILSDSDINLDLGLHLGYNRKLFISGDEGIDLGLSCALTVPLTTTLSVSPSINYSVPFSDLESETDGDQKSRFYTGVSFAYSF
ncbi:MAG: hypothetical protein GF375_07055 [Candidatus Omnitrophica bacterium]|nr:hypothetical protein [Candidatus Omnitrophota bacterium]MBD3269735.1 hypothetical protein [Candidatus Omnitrophota bacterium]